MPIAVICYSCGKSLSVPDDYNRRKVRCPDCGVYCELPAEKEKKRTAAGSQSNTSERVAEEIFTSNRSERTTPAPPVLPQPRPSPPPPPTPSVEDEDRDTYSVTPARERRCPGCEREVANDARVCESCGFDLEAGKKPARVYESRTWQWDAGMPFRKRRNIFIALQILPLTLGLATAAMSGYAVSYLITWLTSAVLLAFLLGTFPRVDLSRGKRGQVRLSKTWRVCFIERPTETIAWREYEGFAVGKADDTDLIDWLMLLVLFSSGSALSWPFGFALPILGRAAVSLVCGVLSDVFWWYFVIRRVTFYVALCKNHAYPELMLYRGWNEPMMEEMAGVLGEVTDLPNLSSGTY
jgi:hypothetical protein